MQKCIKKAAVNQAHKHTFTFSTLILGTKIPQYLLDGSNNKISVLKLNSINIYRTVT
jgi:hypothetical protein